MASIVIVDLETNTELNRNAMSNIVGGTDPTRSRARANELECDDSAEPESILGRPNSRNFYDRKMNLLEVS